MASELEVGKVNAGQLTVNDTTAGSDWNTIAGFQRSGTEVLDVKSNGTNLQLVNENTSGWVGVATGTGGNIRLKVDSTGDVDISTANAALTLGSTAGNGSPSLKLCEQVVSGDISNGFSFNVDGDGTNDLHIKRHVVSSNGTDVLVLNRDTGLATFSGGIKSEKGILSGTVLIDDEGVTTITPPRKGGFMKLLVDSATTEAGQYPQNIHSGEVFFDCGSSLGIVKCDLSSSLATQLDVSVSNLTGTTGTNGNVTIAVQSDVIKIENQSGYQYRFNYFLYC